MSRSLSSAMLQAINAQDTGDAILMLVTINHSSLASPIRVTSDGVDTVSNGNTFVPCPFEFEFPNDDDDSEMVSSIRVDNVDRTMVQAIRNASSAPTVTVQVVRGADPDTIEAEWPDFSLVQANYDVFKVSGKIQVESWEQEPFPAGKFDPIGFPGMF